MENKMKERIVNYDCMRVLMSLFVICIHVHGAKHLVDSYNKLLYNFIILFLSQCNYVFFMISAKFNLSKKFECKKDYISYYINKFITIIVPYGLISSLMVLYDIIETEQHFSIIGYINECIRAFFYTNAAYNHLWFVCTLIGILLSNPFLAKMVSSMKDDELKILFWVGIAWNVISIYLITGLGKSFLLSGWVFGGWIFVYFIGYFCERIINDKNIKIIYCLGIVGFIITVLGMTYLETYQISEEGVLYIFFTMSCYLFMQRHIKINNATLKKVFCPVITYLAKYSYVAYMVHWSVLHIISDKCDGIIQLILLTFIISYLAAILITKILIKPIQVILLKLIVLTNREKMIN